MGHESNACAVGVGVGVIAFLACLAFLLIDARFDMFSSVKIRRRCVLFDLIFSGAWSFVWFLCFIYMVGAWHSVTEAEAEKANGHLVRLSIAFAFFSIITWV
jgi:hypothetical protein